MCFCYYLITQTDTALLSWLYITQQAEAAILQLLPTLDGNLVGVEGLRIFLLLTALLYVIQKREVEPATKLAEGLAAALQRLSAENLQVTGTMENV